MRRIVFSLMGVFFTSLIHSQVVKNVVVEHFTNTKCSICASRNPGFYTNLSNQSGILHVTFHPSAPYSDCFLNNLNPAENDDRTKYYNLFGSTPKFVIQGETVASSTNINNPSLFAPYTGKTSEANLEITHEKFGTDSINVRVKITTEAANPYDDLRLFVALVEDTVAYQAPNGENEHYDVFRKALTNIEGDQMTLPANVMDSVVFVYSQVIDPEWNLKRIYALAILQEEVNKKVVQSNATSSEPAGTPLGISDQNKLNLEVYPNPVNDVLTIKSTDEIIAVDLIDIQGKRHYIEQQLTGENLKLNVSSFQPGIYFLSIRTKRGLVNKKVVIE